MKLRDLTESPDPTIIQQIVKHFIDANESSFMGEDDVHFDGKFKKNGTYEALASAIDEYTADDEADTIEMPISLYLMGKKASS